jgi:hypothetical protein
MVGRLAAGAVPPNSHRRIGMRSRLLVIGTVVGAIVLFAWQSISNGVFRLPEKGLRQFPNDSGSASAAHAIRVLAPENGIYFSRYGVLSAVAISPDYGDKTQQFVSMMVKQVVIDLAVVFVLVLFADRLASASVWRTGLTYGALALASMGCIDVSNWVWWNFPLSYTLANVADQVIGFFLVGLTIAAIGRRYTRVEVETAERQGVKAGAAPKSGLGSGVGVGR